VHAIVLVEDNSVPNAQKLLNRPVHDSVTPERRNGADHSSGGALDVDLAEGGLDELLWGRDQHGRLANLAHRAGDKISDDELGVDAVGLQLSTESGGPVLEERLGARVGGEQRGREEATERAHGEDQTATTSDHAGGDNLGDLKGALDVDGDDVLHLRIVRLQERNRDVMALSDIVDEDGNIQSVDQLRKPLVVVGGVLGKVHGQDLGLDAGVFSLDLGSEGGELAGGARDEDDVEPLLRELQRELFTDAVGCAGDHRPGTLGSILAELFAVALVAGSRRRWKLKSFVEIEDGVREDGSSGAVLKERMASLRWFR
jgi:hypothetical protein